MDSALVGPQEGMARLASALAGVAEAISNWRNSDAVLAAVVSIYEAVSRMRKYRAVLPIERAVERRVGVVLKRQGRLFVSKMARLRGQFREDREDNIDTIWGETASETADAMDAALQLGAAAAMKAGAKMLLSDLDLGIDLSFKLDNPRARAYLATLSAQRVRIDATSRDEIRKIILAGFNANKTYDQIARDLIKQFAAFAAPRPQQHIQTRAHLIAVTEVGNAYEAGARVVADDLSDGGLQMEKYWLTSRDDRVSDGCRENEAQGWIPKESSFKSGHAHPLRFPGCRCTALYRRKGSEG